MAGKLVIIHGGGPTAVINGSLYGAIVEAKKNPAISTVYVAIGGTGGLMKEQLKDVTDLSEAQLALLLQSPASAIGTSRDALYEEEYAVIRKVLKKYEIQYVLLNGGNGTMDTCGRLYEYCKDDGIYVMGIPKTMDNDISVTDHCPGFGSAARYMAGSVAEVCADVASLPIHVAVIEASGRNAGWVTAASALSADSYHIGPDLIYLPERNFSEDAFLEDVSRIIKEKGFGVVVVSEGLHDSEKKPIAKPIFKTERATYFGDVSSHLANLIVEKLGYKARSEKPGLLGRASIAWQSRVDVEEAIVCGREALLAAIAGNSGKMVAIRRLSDAPYACETFLVDIKEVMMFERVLPDAYINAAGNGITESFKEWCRPLLGDALPKIIDLR